MQNKTLELVQKIFPKVVTFKWRSPRWRQVRDAYLKDHPKCECCGRVKKIEVHHIKPFYLFPELELVATNFISLCDGRCHLLIGHLGDYRSYNLGVRHDAEYIRTKIKNRPD